MKKCSYCGKESDDALAMCRECGTPLPEEPSQVRPPRIETAAELRLRRKALGKGLLEAAFAIGVFLVGWIYPAWFIAKDPIMQHDTDTRLGPAVLFAITVGFLFAVLAVRDLLRACRREVASTSK
jgi:hypothetical protein